MNVLVVGASSSGKSMFAQRLSRYLAVKSSSQLIYFATMKPVDIEDRIRISNHVKERNGWNFKTIECDKDVYLEIQNVTNCSVLFDSTTALLSNEMFGKDCDDNAHTRICEDIKLLSNNCKDMVVVGDNIFDDEGDYDIYCNAYVRSLGIIHIFIASFFDIVLEIVSGCVIIHKGKELEKIAFAALQ